MAALMSKIDQTLLGPLRPNATASRSSPSPLPVIVFTASGDQGRSVADALASDGAFTVTAITKFPQSDAAHDLKGKGVRVVEGDMTDPGSYVGYLEGMGAAFVSMDFLDTFHHIGPNMTGAIELEVRLSIAAIEACHKAGIPHIVYSALDDLPDEVRVPTYVSKAKVVEHIKATGIPHTLLFTSHPYTDILAWDLLAPAPCGHGLILSIPAPDDCVIPGYAMEQIGDWVKVALKKPKKWIGQDMYICAERPTVAKMAADMSKVLKVQVGTLGLSKEEFYSQGHREATGEAMWAQYRACYEQSFERDPVKSEKIAPRQWQFRQWVAQSKAVKEIAEPVLKSGKGGHHHHH